jgi:hypothetical protein
MILIMCISSAVHCFHGVPDQFHNMRGSPADLLLLPGLKLVENNYYYLYSVVHAHEPIIFLQITLIGTSGISGSYVELRA